MYEQYLVKLDATPLPALDNSLDGYPRELISCLQGTVNDGYKVYLPVVESL